MILKPCEHILLQTRIGPLVISATEAGVCKITFSSIPPESKFVDSPYNKTVVQSLLEQASREIKAYLAGGLQKFTVPLDLTGTQFQMEVWDSLMNIGYGKQISYKEQAQHLGDPKAIRAIASANGKNPIPLIVPCHRVVGSSGDLTGYLGGIEVKRKLLELEAKYTGKGEQASLF